MQTRQRYESLDRFRMLAAALVVAIHTSPLMSYSAQADFFLTRIFARTAVPFFLMVTGQFVVSGFFQDEEHNDGDAAIMHRNEPVYLWNSVWRYVKKMLLLYGLAVLIYLPAGLYAGQYQNLHITDALRMLVFDGTFYHLWYFPACITGVLLVYGMSRFMNERQAAAAAAILYVIGLFGDSYYGLAERLPAARDIYGAIFRISSYTRNGIFLAPVFLILGAAAGNRQEAYADKHTSFLKAALCISFAAMTAEAFTLRHFQLQRHDSMYAALLPVMFFLYENLLACSRKHPGSGTPDGKLEQAFRTMSLWIYMIHPAVIILVRGAAKYLGLTALFVDNSLVHYAAVWICSAAAAAVISFMVNRHKTKPFCRGRAWMELDHKALQQNVDTLRSRLPESCRLMPAVKADAYGHGAVLIAKELQKMGVDSFCAACVQEGVKLRRSGIKGDILILGYTHPEQFGLLHRYHLTQTVIDHAYAVKLNEYGRKIHVHIGIDTGMHRLGERSENLAQIFDIYHMKHLAVDGLFTHLCASDTKELRSQEFTDLQAEAFYQVVRALKEQGLPCPKIHMQASYGVLNYPKLSGDYARVGIALYGVLSTKEDTQEWQDALHPVLSLKARIAAVKVLYAGESAGYGLQFTADKDMKIATLAIGYADGLPRSLSGGVGSVLIHGQKAPVIGRICMDQTIVDVSGIEGVQAGDTAVLIGHSGELEISVCDLAEQTGTITNEILSRMGARLERVVV